MKHAPMYPRSAAIVSALLCLPFALVFTLLLLNIEPNFGPLEPLLNNPDPDQPDVIGSLIVLGTVVFVLVACVLNLIPIVRTVRAGGTLTAHLVNLVLAVATLASIVMIIGGIIVDQFPCWIGVPNCD